MYWGITSLLLSCIPFNIHMHKQNTRACTQTLKESRTTISTTINTISTINAKNVFTLTSMSDASSRGTCPLLRSGVSDFLGLKQVFAPRMCCVYPLRIVQNYGFACGGRGQTCREFGRWYCASHEKCMRRASSKGCTCRRWHAPCLLWSWRRWFG